MTQISRHTRRRQKALAKGLCKDCARGRRYNSLTRCLDCSFKFLASKHLGSAKRWIELKEALARQNNRCAYSGKEIDIGMNASVEHVQSQSKHEKRRRDITNIKWVDVRVNKSKQDMSLHDYLMLCKSVLTNFGYEIVRDDSK